MRNILVTGANKGIGLAIVQRILDEHDDTFVFLGSRDAERGREAQASLGASAKRVEIVALDVSSEGSVADAAKTVTKPLYGLVNNAGVTEHGHDLQAVLATNVFGTHRVCKAFLPKLEAGGRLVNISSASGPSFVSTLDDDTKRFFLDTTMTWERIEKFLQSADRYAGSAYGLSKACVNLLTMILARENPTLKINGCTPGYIATDMTQHQREAAGKSAEEMGMKSTRDGANVPLWLLFGTPEGNGRYYGSDGKRSPLDRYRSPGSPEYTGP